MNSDDRILTVVATGVFAVGGALAIWLVAVGGGIAHSPQVADTGVRSAQTPATRLASTQPVQPAQNDALGLEMNDDVIRSLVAGISAHPRLAAFFVTDRLVNRFVDAVESVSQGITPMTALDVLAPEGQFIVYDYKLDFAIAQGTFRRFDMVTEVFTSLDVDDVVAVFDEVEATIDADFARAEWGESGFEGVMQQAFVHLLEVQVPDGPYEVERWSRAYVFADDHLQALSDAQRQLLRMGPSNARKIQAKLRELARAFGWNELTEPSFMQAIDESGSADVMEPVLVARVGAQGTNPAIEPSSSPNSIGEPAEIVTTRRLTAEPIDESPEQ